MHGASSPPTSQIFGAIRAQGAGGGRGDRYRLASSLQTTRPCGGRPILDPGSFYVLMRDSGHLSRRTSGCLAGTQACLPACDPKGGLPPTGLQRRANSEVSRACIFSSTHIVPGKGGQEPPIQNTSVIMFSQEFGLFQCY